MFGSTIFAILKPIEADIAWPPMTKAALTICNNKPIKAPIKTCKKTSLNPIAVNGSSKGHSVSG